MRTAHTNRSVALSLFLAAGLGVSVLSPSSSAQIMNWLNISGGTASTAGNWSPAAIPGSANDLVWNLANTYTVTFNSSTTASHTHVYRKGVVTIVATSPHTVSSGITIGDTNTLTGTMTLTTGTLNSTGSVLLGSIAGSSGVLNVNDADAGLIITGSTADLIVASNGPGTLNITGGGLVQVADQFIAGNNSPGTSTVTVSGATNTLPFARSTLNVLGTGVSSKFGQGGDATVSISSGALAQFAGDLVVANGSASNSVVTVGGTGGFLTQNATLSVTGDLLLGNNASAAAAGVGTVTVNSGGSVVVGGTLHVGDDPDGGTGTLNINTGALVQATSVIDGSAGTINHSGGTLRINGGTYTGIPVPYSISGASANNVTLAWANNASQTLVPAGGVSLIVGNSLGAGSWQGFLRVESGAHLDMGNGDIDIGDDTGVTGTVTITGAGSRLIANSVNSDVRVGFNGTGVMQVESGGQLLCKNLLVPALGNADGDVNCTGANSNITTQFLGLGQSIGTGSGVLSVQVGATLNVTDPGFSTNIRSTGYLVVGDNATVSTPGTITVGTGGNLAVHGRVTNAALVDVNSGTLSSGAAGGTPLVDARVHLASGGLLEAIADDFTVGDATSTTGFVGDLGSTINIGTPTLTLLDSDDAVVGAVTLAGGTLAAPNGITIINNGTIDGTGTITTPHLFFNSGGSVITATGANGITVNGLLKNNSGTIDGTKFTFTGTGGGWTGAGAINAKAQFDPGTAITASANMTIGDGSTLGATFNGVMHLSTRNLTINDSNGCALSTLTDMDGGAITSVNGLVVNNGRVLRGHGDITVTNSGLSVFGFIDPDARNAATGIYEGLGRFRVTGTYSQSANSDYLCDIAGFDNEFRPQNDRIDVSGVATLNGTLDVSLFGGYVPVAGDRFTILTASSVVGTFSVENTPPNIIVVYNPDSVELVVGSCAADFNQDGGVDGSDVQAFFASWQAGDPAADVNLDGGVDGSDVQTFFDQWEAGGC